MKTSSRSFPLSHRTSRQCTVDRKTVICQMSRFSASTPILGLLSENDDGSERFGRKYFSSVFHLGGNYDYCTTETQDLQQKCNEIQNLLTSSRQSETRKSFSRSSTVETCETILRLFLIFFRWVEMRWHLCQCSIWVCWWRGNQNTCGVTWGSAHWESTKSSQIFEKHVSEHIWLDHWRLYRGRLGEEERVWGVADRGAYLDNFPDPPGRGAVRQSRGPARQPEQETRIHSLFTGVTVFVLISRCISSYI